MACLFVTGTDTGVGKTVFSIALLAALRGRGIDAVAFKPVETGCPGPPGALLGDDCRALAKVTGQLPGQVAGQLYSLPAAPLVAAAREGRTVDVQALVVRAGELADRHEFVLVEGAGGLLVPLAPSVTWMDFLALSRIPVVCVVGSRLGCINHALLTMSALQSAGTPTAGYVMNELPDDDSPDGNRETIAAFSRLLGGAPCLGSLPRLEPGEVTSTTRMASLAEAGLDIDALIVAATPPNGGGRTTLVMQSP